MKRQFLVLLVIIMNLWALGCATIFKGAKEEVKINSDPQRIDVYLDGEKIGETPISVNLRSKNSYSIVFQKSGFLTQTHALLSHFGVGWLIIDFLAGTFPAIVDLLTGAWYRLEKRIVFAIMEKERMIN